MFENDGCLMKVGPDLTCSFMILKPKQIPSFKICLMSSVEINNPKSQPFLKPYVKSKPAKKILVEGENITAEEH